MADEEFEYGNTIGLDTYLKEKVCKKCVYKEKKVCSYTDEDDDSDETDWCEAIDQLSNLFERVFDFRNKFIEKFDKLEDLFDIEPMKEQTDFIKYQENFIKENNIKILDNN